ncbi:MAG: phosphoribosylformylglycinamidine cyclo-ligase [Clostridia bacterium]|nr:phosphoribosylformylglycinamidine cyclo-ligase [Clostridia bacterium]
MESFSDSYKSAGVDVEAGYESVELIKKHIKKTNTKGVLTDIGAFSGAFRPDLTGMEEPVLISGTDGVGTKLKIAFLMDKHNTVGIDCVAMCVNDIICAGAKPLFFLDYIALGKNIPTKVEQIVSGIAEGCSMSGAALVGGETAEMPGFYPEDEYDLAGFAVGIADKKKMIDSKNLQAGDKIIGLSSSGVHSNGFSLVRKIFDVNADNLKKEVAELGKTLGEELLTPTKIYVKSVLALINQVEVHSMSHITGGGFYENVPRMLNDKLSAKIYKNKLDIKPIFNLIASKGINEHDMFNTFNMGTGFMICVADEDVEKSLSILSENGEEARVIGEIINGDGKVEIC